MFTDVCTIYYLGMIAVSRHREEFLSEKALNKRNTTKSSTKIWTTKKKAPYPGQSNPNGRAPDWKEINDIEFVKSINVS